MKQFLLTLLTIVLLATSAAAQDIKAEPQQFMQITTIESVVGGGMGRSKMITTLSDGTQKESEMNNLFSITGINFKNISQNETNILTALKTYTDEGWKLVQVTPLSLSPGNSSSGIFMTRYLLAKPK
jgi:opacity protein-like surface antigen